MRPNGSILSTPGYDRTTGLYLYTEPDWPLIPDHPTRAQAEDAVRGLLAPFAEFPFVGDEDYYLLKQCIAAGLQNQNGKCL